MQTAKPINPTSRIGVNATNRETGQPIHRTYYETTPTEIHAVLRFVVEHGGLRRLRALVKGAQQGA